MSSVVDICNLAVSHLGSKATIASISEGSTESIVCRTHFYTVRDALLAEFNWNFSRRVEVMALRTETPPPGWAYAFSYPSKCIRVRQIWIQPPPATLPPVRFEVGGLEDSGGNDVVAIFANVSEGYVQYTRRIENAELFSAGFVLALSWRLAEAIALPITNRESIQELTIKLAAFKVEMGKAMDAGEGIQIVSDADPEYITARGG